MTTLQGFLLAAGWFLLRFGVPVVATVLVCRFFQKLDARWQADAAEYQQINREDGLVPAIRCWVFNDCPEEKRAGCQVYQEPQTPCWQHFRAESGELKEGCIGCGVFRSTPILVSGD
jgi:hypothetical protein